MKYSFAALLCVLLACSAQAQPQPPRDQVQRANQGTVGVITGMVGGTYARSGADLTILDDDSLRVLPTIGKGSLQNLSDILYLKGVDIGFVQADALTYAKQHGMFPTITQNIRYIAKLFDEEVHVLARKDITRLEDLNGQRVNVDVVGSGSAMTAEILLQAFGVKPEIEHQMQVAAVQSLLRGEIAALIHVAGAPVPLLTNIPASAELHFLRVPINQTLAETYLPDQITHDNYPALVPADAPVPTIAVGDVMAVFGWAPRTERYNKVAHFVDVFFSKFDQLQQPPRHPKWREVNLAAEVPGWTRFPPAQEWLARQAAAGVADRATQDRFNAFLGRSTANTNGKLSDAEKQALFQQFLNWNRQQAAAR